ncbi:hypothetical protein P9D98_20235 [Bacillus mojavensis]|uniref:hypothetical protein n=1 Tax=Bacillus mojavensis TaxID=72360 RepID=UPI002DB63C73|nr:hypothetical protein [Bacillus mojavensis]MEC1636897.1 hypothetical protein [Bacillus mojavensis]
MDNRKMLLRQKLKINKQKSLRVTLMSTLPRDMSTLPRDMATTIEDCSLITSPELERILDKVQKKWNFELHKNDFAIKYSEHRKEYSWEYEVINHVQQTKLPDEQVYLYLGIEDIPIFLINGNWIIENFNFLWEQINNSDLWIIDFNFKYGVLVSRYGGYLDHDPNPNEIIYAVTEWGI